MALSLNDIIRSVSNLTNAGLDEMVGVFHHVVNTLGTAVDADMPDIMGAVLEDIYTNIVPVISDNFVFDHCEAFNVTDNRPYGFFPWPSLVTGSAGGSYLPTSDTCYAFARTVVGGLRGSKFWPGSTEDTYQDGFWTGAALADYILATADYTAIFSDIITGLVLVPGVVRSTILPGQFEPFIGGVTRAVVQPLQRRKPKVGS